jgi:endonuclease/exonuclease/phosphatase family metal-dependent hydrolase
MRKRGVVAPAMGHWGIAVVSRYPIRTVGELPLGEVPLDPVEHRRALHLELDVDGSLCDLVATHISAITILGPALQLRRLGPQLPHDATRPAIVVGDLNVTWPVIRSCIGPGFRRAVVGATWPSSHLVCQIDHLLVNDAVRVLDSAITRHVGSDHRPITATLAW